MNERSKKTGDIFSRIRNLDKLTRGESAIASFFEDNINMLAFENLTVLSERSGVSKASMVRFLKHRLGYESFAQFQNERQELMEHRLDSPVRRYVRNQSVFDLFDGGKQSALETHVPEVLQHIQDVCNYLYPEKIEEVATLLAHEKNSIYLLGQRSSYSLAHMFYVNLLHFRPNFFMLGGLDSTMPPEIFNASAGDTVFVIHRRRYSKNTYDIARQLKLAGLSLILLTDSEISPLSSMADLQIVVPDSKTKNFLSECAWIAVLESIVLTVAKMSKEEDSQYIEKVEKTLQHFFGINSEKNH